MLVYVSCVSSNSFHTLNFLGKINAFGRPGKKDEEIVDGLIEEMDLKQYENKPYTELSGGERQHVMIARA